MEALKLRSEEPVDEISASACPLCDDLETNHPGPDHPTSQPSSEDNISSEPSVTLRQFRRHLGRHMEQLALFALPKREVEEVNEKLGTLVDLQEGQNKEMKKEDVANRNAGDDVTVQTFIEAPFNKAEDIPQPKLSTIIEFQNLEENTPKQYSNVRSTKEKSGIGYKIINPMKRWAKSQRISFDGSSSSAPTSSSGRTWSDSSSTISTFGSVLSWQNSSSSSTSKFVPKLTNKAHYMVTPLQIRELGELIRLRYALDNMIWGQRHCSPVSRPLVEEIGRRADATLREIISIVEAWDNPDVWDPQSGDWQRLREIKRRIEMGGKRTWADNPPWEEKEKALPLRPYCG
jgi:hypothetical protein